MMSQSEMQKREMDDQYGGEQGDPRCCPRHPHVKTSSPDGMFDAPCGACESEMSEDPNDLQVQRTDLTASPGRGDRHVRLTAFASDIGLAPGRIRPATITVPTRDRRTLVVYEYRQADKNRDNEILSWLYTPTAASRYRTPACANTDILIYND